MEHRRLNHLLLALCVFWAIRAVAEESLPSDIVPLDQEPRHHLSLESRHVRIFDVRIPAGDTTLYHRHGRDSIYVAISGTTKLVTQEYGKASNPLLIKPGDVSYAEHSKSP